MNSDIDCIVLFIFSGEGTGDVFRSPRRTENSAPASHCVDVSPRGQKLVGRATLGMYAFPRRRRQTEIAGSNRVSSDQAQLVRQTGLTYLHPWRSQMQAVSRKCGIAIKMASLRPRTSIDTPLTGCGRYWEGGWINGGRQAWRTAEEIAVTKTSANVTMGLVGGGGMPIPIHDPGGGAICLPWPARAQRSPRVCRSG